MESQSVPAGIWAYPPSIPPVVSKTALPTAVAEGSPQLTALIPLPLNFHSDIGSGKAPRQKL